MSIHYRAGRNDHRGVFGTASIYRHGDGTFFAGETVRIVADAGTGDQQFTGWSGNAEFEDRLSRETTFTMPAADVTVTANYSLLKVRSCRDEWHRQR